MILLVCVHERKHGVSNVKTRCMIEQDALVIYNGLKKNTMILKWHMQTPTIMWVLVQI